MAITTVFFDLDDTLYPSSSGLWQQIKSRIGLYMRDKLNIPSEQVQPIRQEMFEQYGTTLRGLQVNYPVNVAEFLAFVHDVPLIDYIQPDPLLRSVIKSLPVRKFIFTNADSAHARRVLHVLELEDCFDGIIDVISIDPYCKPMPQSFEIALNLAGENHPGCCAIIDDIPRTTRAARLFGIFSILYGTPEADSDADAVLTNWSCLSELIQERI